jgi:hypothetical protein
MWVMFGYVGNRGNRCSKKKGAVYVVEIMTCEEVEHPSGSIQVSAAFSPALHILI